jgi:hypothetical protein
MHRCCPICCSNELAVVYIVDVLVRCVGEALRTTHKRTLVLLARLRRSTAPRKVGRNEAASYTNVAAPSRQCRRIALLFDQISGNAHPLTAATKYWKGVTSQETRPKRQTVCSPQTGTKPTPEERPQPTVVAADGCGAGCGGHQRCHARASGSGGQQHHSGAPSITPSSHQLRGVPPSTQMSILPSTGHRWARVPASTTTGVTECHSAPPPSATQYGGRHAQRAHQAGVLSTTQHLKAPFTASCTRPRQGSRAGQRRTGGPSTTPGAPPVS